MTTSEFSFAGPPPAAKPKPSMLRKMRRLANVTLYQLAPAMHRSVPRLSVLERQPSCRPETYAKYLHALTIVQAERKASNG